MDSLIYQPTGMLNISLGERKENQNRIAWNEPDGPILQAAFDVYNSSIATIKFYESADFLMKHKDKHFYFTTSGKAIDVFGSKYKPPTVMAYFDGYKGDVQDFLQLKTIVFSGDNSIDCGKVDVKIYKV